ncbi:hypothetical protein Godav_002895 [Gossypium davidsonii]|uniref:RNase H type-1 domain-containing protein n=1 Tax=Gossypium davidsonii TaxID=34287 RepID=A0A7J8SXK6_GOSDV|nr:hypothetical protein [Gossypium davidsonii]
MCFVFYAELWGIFDGLIILQDRGLNSILIHTDSLEIRHVQGEANVVVDRIAKRVFAKREEVNVLTSAPTDSSLSQK